MQFTNGPRRIGLVAALGIWSTFGSGYIMADACESQPKPQCLKVVVTKPKGANKIWQTDKVSVTNNCSRALSLKIDVKNGDDYYFQLTNGYNITLKGGDVFGPIGSFRGISCCSSAGPCDIK